MDQIAKINAAFVTALWSENYTYCMGTKANYHNCI